MDNRSSDSGFFDVSERIFTGVTGVDYDGKIVSSCEFGHGEKEDFLGFFLLFLLSLFEMIIIESDFADGNDVLTICDQKLFEFRNYFGYIFSNEHLSFGGVVSDGSIVLLVSSREFYRLLARP